MKRYQHVLVYLSLRDDDASVLQWAGRIATWAGSSQVTVLHAWSYFDIPPTLQEKYPWLMVPGLELIERRMDDLIERNLRVAEGTTVNRSVQEGNPLAEILNLATRQAVDLVVVHRETRDPSLAEKLARKAPCSVLSVPNDARLDPGHILVGFDFSEFSRGALEVAVAFAQAAKARLSVLHSFDVPWGYHKTGIPREQIAAETRAYLSEELARETTNARASITEHDLAVVEFPLPEVALSRFAKERECGLVVMGCRGHGAIYATLLGSTAESILREAPVPVLAVKPKGSGLSILEQLRQSDVH